MLAYLLAIIVSITGIFGPEVWLAIEPTESDFRILGGLAIMAMILSAPIALPLIVYSELRRHDDWRTFALAGAALGLFVSALFWEIGQPWPDPALSIRFLLTSIAAALTYWLVVWRLRPKLGQELKKRPQ